MNGFELVSHRRVIDSTSAGQWDVTYDGPIDECEEYKLRAENAKLRELVRDMWAWQDALPLVMRAEIRDRMRELGVEVS